MRKILMGAVALAALAGAGVAVAQTQGGPPPGAPPPGGPHGMLERLDTNNDGNVSRAEFDAGGAAMFARMDANRDGQVTREEMRAARPEGGPEGRGPGDDDHGGRGGWRNPDANNDGVITRQEFLAGPTQMFERLDANHDGRLTGEEKPSHERGERHSRRGGGPRHADANGDGVVSRAEFSARNAERFERMDRNNDGQLNADDRQGRRGS